MCLTKVGDQCFTELFTEIFEWKQKLMLLTPDSTLQTTFFSFLNKSRNKEMELRLGKNYTPVPLGQLGQTCKPHSTLSLRVSGSRMSP